MIETHFNDQMIVVKDPDVAEHWSVDWILSMWEKDPTLRFLVVASNTPIAVDFCRKAQGACDVDLCPPLNNRTIETSAGGYARYCSFGSALAGLQVDFAVVSDTYPYELHDPREVVNWINHTIRCRLVPK